MAAIPAQSGRKWLTAKNRRWCMAGQERMPRSPGMTERVQAGRTGLGRRLGFPTPRGQEEVAQGQLGGPS